VPETVRLAVPLPEGPGTTPVPVLELSGPELVGAGPDPESLVVEPRPPVPVTVPVGAGRVVFQGLASKSRRGKEGNAHRATGRRRRSSNTLRKPLRSSCAEAPREAILDRGGRTGLAEAVVVVGSSRHGRTARAAGGGGAGRVACGASCASGIGGCGSGGCSCPGTARSSWTPWGRAAGTETGTATAAGAPAGLGGVGEGQGEESSESESEKRGVDHGDGWAVSWWFP